MEMTTIHVYTLTNGSCSFQALTVPSEEAENKRSAAGDNARPFTLHGNTVKVQTNGQ